MLTNENYWLVEIPQLVFIKQTDKLTASKEYLNLPVTIAVSVSVRHSISVKIIWKQHAQLLSANNNYF